MTAITVLIILNIFCFSGLFTLAEINRQKIDAASRELKKFTGIADEIKKNPGKVRRDMHAAVNALDDHLASATPFPACGNMAGCVGRSQCGLTGTPFCPYAGPDTGPDFRTNGGGHLSGPDFPFNTDGQ